METELSTQWRPEQICEELSIEKSTYYNRLKYLEIEPSRDDEGPYLTQDQRKLMQELNEHIRKTGKMRGFRGGGELAISENSGLASALPEQLEPETSGEVDDEVLDKLIWDAAELKAQQVVRSELLKLHLAAGMSEDDLPADLKAKVQAIRDAANPKPNAAASVAQQLLQRHRQKQQQKNQEPQ